MLQTWAAARPDESLVGHSRGRNERVCALVLLIALLGLVPLAHASPPDPTWIAGIYDDQDCDDVVLAVVSAMGAVEGAPLRVLPGTPLVVSVSLAQVPIIAAPPKLTSPGRAPPR